MGFPNGKESAYEGDLGLIPELGRSAGGGHGNPLQYSYLENPHGQRSLVDYSSWGCKESDTAEQQSTARIFTIFFQFRIINIISVYIRIVMNLWKTY